MQADAAVAPTVLVKRATGAGQGTLISEHEQTVLNLISKRPDCAAGSWVTVIGTIKHLRAGPASKAIVIDAAAVTCLAREKWHSDAPAAFADDRHPGSHPESGQPTGTRGK